MTELGGSGTIRGRYVQEWREALNPLIAQLYEQAYNEADFWGKLGIKAALARRKIKQWMT